MTITRAQAHAMVMKQQTQHPDCLDSKVKWDSYVRPFSWDVVQWCKYSEEAIRCTGIARCLNEFFKLNDIPEQQIFEIWDGVTNLMEMLNDKIRIK